MIGYLSLSFFFNHFDMPLLTQSNNKGYADRWKQEHRTKTLTKTTRASVCVPDCVGGIHAWMYAYVSRN